MSKSGKKGAHSNDLGEILKIQCRFYGLKIIKINVLQTALHPPWDDYITKVYSSKSNGSGIVMGISGDIELPWFGYKTYSTGFIWTRARACIRGVGQLDYSVQIAPIHQNGPTVNMVLCQCWSRNMINF